MLFIRPWTQFFDLKGEEGIKLSYARNITLRNIDLECNVLFDVSNSNQYELSDFTFENMKIKARSEEHTSELQSRENLVCRLLLEKKELMTCTLLCKSAKKSQFT